MYELGNYQHLQYLLSLSMGTIENMTSCGIRISIVFPYGHGRETKQAPKLAENLFSRHRALPRPRRDHKHCSSPQQRIAPPRHHILACKPLSLRILPSKLESSNNRNHGSPILCRRKLQDVSYHSQQ